MSIPPLTLTTLFPMSYPFRFFYSSFIPLYMLKQVPAVGRPSVPSSSLPVIGKEVPHIDIVDLSILKQAQGDKADTGFLGSLLPGGPIG